MSSTDEGRILAGMDSADRRSRSTGYKDIKLDDLDAIEDTQELNTSRKHKKTDKPASTATRDSHHKYIIAIWY
jgi:hypothetical protein